MKGTTASLAQLHSAADTIFLRDVGKTHSRVALPHAVTLQNHAKDGHNCGSKSRCVTEWAATAVANYCYFLPKNVSEEDALKKREDFTRPRGRAVRRCCVGGRGGTHSLIAPKLHGTTSQSEHE